MSEVGRGNNPGKERTDSSMRLKNAKYHWRVLGVSLRLTSVSGRNLRGSRIWDQSRGFGVQLLVDQVTGKQGGRKLDEAHHLETQSLSLLLKLYQHLGFQPQPDQTSTDTQNHTFWTLLPSYTMSPQTYYSVIGTWHCSLIDSILQPWPAQTRDKVLSFMIELFSSGVCICPSFGEFMCLFLWYTSESIFPASLGTTLSTPGWIPRSHIWPQFTEERSDVSHRVNQSFLLLGVGNLWWNQSLRCLQEESQ